jgi:hypothetical protein
LDEFESKDYTGTGKKKHEVAEKYKYRKETAQARKKGGKKLSDP